MLMILINYLVNLLFNYKMKLISLYTFIFLFTFTNEIRLLEGKSKRSSDRYRSTSPKKNGGNL